MRTPSQILQESKTIAIVGLSPNQARDSNSVAIYLRDNGYTIIPVNPKVDEVLGLRCYPSLSDIPTKIDIVDVFRRSEDVLPITEAAIAIKAKVLWLQLDVINKQAAALAEKAGLDVVMNECTARLHSRLENRGLL
ncbi:CoA-binding protein [Dehalococcoidia bacterium]|nr:CoA-binding protein [Dehalococcoidia bacterium]